MAAIKLDEFEADILAKMKADPEFAAEFLDEATRRPLSVQLVVLRRLLGWTQARLAKELGLKQTHISRLEKRGSDHRTKLYARAAKEFGARLAFIPPGYRLVRESEATTTHSLTAEPRRPYKAKRRRGPR